MLAAAGALLVSPLVLAGPASAHDSIVGSQPADGATVTTPPTQVRITFEEPPTAPGLAVAVMAPGGTSVVAGPPTIEGNVVVQELTALSVGGAYSVSYRVVSADGHPVTGTFRFTYDAGSSSPSASPTASASSGSLSATFVATASPSSDTSGTDLTPWVVAGSVALLGVVVLGGVAFSRRRSA
jgi:methionine-rich copper-binding protein CopC